MNNYKNKPTGPAENRSIYAPIPSTLGIANKGAGKMKATVGLTDDVLSLENSFDDFSSPLLTIPELAKFLKISPTGVRRLQQQRLIPFIKVLGSVRFRKQDVNAYLLKQRVETIE